MVNLAIRKFVHSSYRIFAGVASNMDNWKQQERGDVDIGRFLDGLRQSSQNFRDQLATLLSDIFLIETSIAGANSFQHEYELTAYITAIWHLFEIFFLGQGNSMSLEMITWLKVSNSSSCLSCAPTLFLGLELLTTWTNLTDSNSFVTFLFFNPHHPIEFHVQMNGSPSVDLQYTMETFRNTPNPQLIVSNTEDGMDDGEDGYWECVFRLVTEGRLVDVWEILALHGDVVYIINGIEQGTGSAVDDVDYRDLKRIYEVLTAHPYAAAVVSQQDQQQQPLSVDYRLPFNDWQSGVSRLLQNNPPILARIPELSTLLLLLLADAELLVVWGRGDWATIATGLFLYKYPPPLVRSAIDRAVGEAMDLAPLAPLPALSEDERAREVRLRGATRSVLQGNVSPVLRQLVELCGWGRPVSDYSSLFGLLCVGHMTYLLAHAGRANTSTSSGSLHVINPTVEILGELLLSEDSAMTATMPNEASFVEELFLEASQRLNELDFPVDVAVGYLHACPRKGVEYARVLLPRRLMGSDAATVAVSAALRTLGLIIEARAVEAARGSWWLQSWPGQCIASDELNGETGTGMRVVKALRFFQLAGDGQRSRALLDRALWRLSTAVVRASQALEREPRAGDSAAVWTRVYPLLPRGLRLLPVRPRGPCRRGDYTKADYWDLNHYIEHHDDTTSNAVVATSRLLHAINHAEQLLGAVLCGETATSSATVCLTSYVSMVRAMVMAQPPPGRSTGSGSVPGLAGSSADMNGLLVSLPVSVWSMIGQVEAGPSSSQDGVVGTGGEAGAGGVEEVLQRAANTVCTLVNEEVAPMRFWLHLLDLAVGIDRVKYSSTQRCLFHKDQVYCLLAAAERVLQWHAHYAAKPVGAHAAPVPGDDDAQALRLGLLGLFTGAVVQANADAGVTRSVQAERARMLQVSRSVGTSAEFGGRRPRTAIDMLSASAFL